MTTPLGAGCSDKLDSPESGCHTDNHYPRGTQRGCLQASSMMKPAGRATHFPTYPTPFLLSCHLKQDFRSRAGGHAGLVGSAGLASDHVVLGPGSHHGPRTPNPAGLPPEQATPGARLPLETRASTESRRFTEISTFTLREERSGQGPSNCPLQALFMGSICLMGYNLFHFIFAELPWEPEL